MKTPSLLLIVLLASSLGVACASTRPVGLDEERDTARLMAFNIRDLRPEHIMDDADERVAQSIGIIRESDACVVLVNEMAHTPDGRHVARFADRLAQGTAHTWTGYAAPSNTGIHAGLDFDNNGQIDPDDDGRIYGGDCYGYGEFPGHYAMALFVRSDVEILWQDIRTFRTLLWKDMPGAMLPPGLTARQWWYDEEEIAVFRLSSKSHWDVPVRLADGRVIHLLCSHPTPPVFDGEEDRNGRRNHDEIRLWLDYIDGKDWIVDDAGQRGGLPENASFIIMGDLNADPDEGDARNNPAGSMLAHPRVNSTFTPTSQTPWTSQRRGPLDDDDTAPFGLRIDYVQPSTDLPVREGGVIRSSLDMPGGVMPGGDFVASDHFPVWIGLGLDARR